MRYPKHLQPGETIGFAAPSFGCAAEPYKSAFDEALMRFQKLGHGIELGPNCYAAQGIGISNTPKLCGEELTEAYCSEKSRALISCGGGELMCETMDHVDFERIRAAKPKWFLGYSDNTNMTFLLTTLCDTASLYGPCAAAFGMRPWHPSIQDAYDVLCGMTHTVHNYPAFELESKKDAEHPYEPYHCTEKTELRVYPSPTEQRLAKDSTITVQGRLIGGCLDCLVNLAGTEYDRVAEYAERYQEDGILWFLESCELGPMAIRRAMWNLRHAGWFSHVKGFLIGRPLMYQQEMLGMDTYQAVLGALSGLNVPVIMDADIGHLPPMMPIICGSAAEVTVKNGQLKMKMEER